MTEIGGRRCIHSTASRGGNINRYTRFEARLHVSHAHWSQTWPRRTAATSRPQSLQPIHPTPHLPSVNVSVLRRPGPISSRSASIFRTEQPTREAQHPSKREVSPRPIRPFPRIGEAFPPFDDGCRAVRSICSDVLDFPSLAINLGAGSVKTSSFRYVRTNANVGSSFPMGFVSQRTAVRLRCLDGAFPSHPHSFAV